MVNAHVAMQISNYYQTALTNLMKTGISSIVSKRFRVSLIILELMKIMSVYY